MKFTWMIWVFSLVMGVSMASAGLEGAVGIWLFETIDGETVEDSSGNGNHGIVRGGAKLSPDGAFGNAIELNGTNQYVEVPDSDSLDLEDAVTMVNWFFYAGGGDGWQTFFSKGPMSGNNENYAHFINTGGMYTHFITNAGGRSNLDSPGGAFEVGKWHHAAAVYDGSEKIIYIDGEEVARGAKSGKLIPNDNYLGLGYREGSPHYWKGMLDEMAIFNRPLSADEIKSIMNKGLKSSAAVGVGSKLPTVWAELKK